MVIIRQLNEMDKSAYRQARLECLKAYPDNFGSLYEEEKLKAELYFEKCLSDRESPNFMFGAFDGDRCVGLCGFVREDRTRTKHRGEIVQMFVHADYQGQGVGRELLQNVIQKAFETEEMEQIVLSLVASNVGAHTLYKRLGFLDYGLMPNYFKTETGYLNQRFMLLTK